MLKSLFNDLPICKFPASVAKCLTLIWVEFLGIQNGVERGGVKLPRPTV